MLLPNGGGALIARPGRTGHRPVDGRGLENDLAPVRGMYTCYSAGGYCSLRTHGIVTCGPTGGIALASGGADGDGEAGHETRWRVRAADLV